METEIQNSELAGRKARKEDERARPEGGAVRWTCNRCRMGFAVQKPHACAEWTTCAEEGCGRRFWSAENKRNGRHVAAVGVWPLPESPIVTGSNIEKTAIHLERIWNASKSGNVHATELFDAVQAVCKAVQAAEGRT